MLGRAFNEEENNPSTWIMVSAWAWQRQFGVISCGWKIDQYNGEP